MGEMKDIYTTNLIGIACLQVIYTTGRSASSDGTYFRTVRGCRLCVQLEHMKDAAVITVSSIRSSPESSAV